MNRRLLIPAAVIVFAAAAGVFAESYPSKPIRFIVPTAAGGTQDLMARIIAGKLTEQMKQQVIVDQRPGGSGIIGAQIAKSAAPDGYTLLLATSTAFGAMPVLRSKLPYDADRDFSPLTRIGWAANVVGVYPGAGANSMGELVNLARAQPGKLNYGSTGVGSPSHLAAAMLNVLAGLNTVNVNYRGSAPALTDLIAGQIQLFITSPAAAGPHARAGRVRLLATTAASRDPLLPDLPAVAETVPGYDFIQWWGVVVPARTPPPVLKRLHQEILIAIGAQDVRNVMRRDGVTPHPESPAEFAAFIKKDRGRIAHIVKEANIALSD